MEQYKPPGLIKKMYFKHLTFGDAPFKIENVWVEEQSKDNVLMEVVPTGACTNAAESDGGCCGVLCGKHALCWGLCRLSSKLTCGSSLK